MLYEKTLAKLHSYNGTSNKKLSGSAGNYNDLGKKIEKNFLNFKIDVTL